MENVKLRQTDTIRNMLELYFSMRVDIIYLEALRCPKVSYQIIEQTFEVPMCFK